MLKKIILFALIEDLKDTINENNLDQYSDKKVIEEWLSHISCYM